MGEVECTAEGITTPFCFSVHFIWLTLISFTHGLYKCVLICLPVMFLFKTTVLSFWHVCVFTSECLAELYLIKSTSGSSFPLWKMDGTVNANKTWWVRVQHRVLYCPTMPQNEHKPFIQWLTPWTRSSLSHNEKTVRGVDMVWKLCDKEESPKFKWLVELLFALCGKRLNCCKKQQKMLDG